MSTELSKDAGGPQPAVERRVPPRFGDIAADALRYWEPRRALYNAVLAGVVAAHVVAGWPATRALLVWNTLFSLIFLAVLANVCYCAAYAVDVFVQYSGLRDAWARRRWILLTIGIVFAAVIAHFFSMGILSEPR